MLLTQAGMENGRLQVLARPCEGDPASAQLLRDAVANVPGADDLAVLDDIENCLVVGSTQKVHPGSRVFVSRIERCQQ